MEVKVIYQLSLDKSVTEEPRHSSVMDTREQDQDR